jgi:hypothetical protein
LFGDFCTNWFEYYESSGKRMVVKIWGVADESGEQVSLGYWFVDKTESGILSLTPGDGAKPEILRNTPGAPLVIEPEERLGKEFPSGI